MPIMVRESSNQSSQKNIYNYRNSPKKINSKNISGILKRNSSKKSVKYEQKEIFKNYFIKNKYEKLFK